MLYLQIFLTTFLATLIITPFIIKHFISVGIVDKPNKRKVHSSIIPRMGGVIIYLVSIISFLVFVKDIENYRVFLVASILIAIIGNLDDAFGLKWNYKFFAQLTAASFIALEIFLKIDNVLLLGFVLPDLIAVLLYVFLVIGLLNAINFLDGLDGLVSGYSIVSFTVILLLSFTIKNQFLIIASVGILGSLLGFMKFNTYPAKIFLGDTGSLSIAFIMTYIVSVLSYNIPGQKNNLDLTFLLLFFALPITDTLKVILKRIYYKKSPFAPDKSHLHHKILGLEISQKITTFIIHLFTLLFVLISIFYFFDQKLLYIMLAFVLVIIIFFIPTLAKFIKDNYLNKINYNFKTVPNFIVPIFLFIFPLLSIITVTLFVLPVISKESIFDNFELGFIILIYIILFIISNNRRKIVEQQNNLYVFFNIILFLALFKITEQTKNIEIFGFIFQAKVMLYLAVGLSIFLIIYFVYGRERIFQQKVSLFYGQDLLLVIIMLLLFILHNFVNYDKLSQFNLIFITAFFIYSNYLIAIKVYPKVEKLLYYLSHIIPLFTIVYLIFIN